MNKYFVQINRNMMVSIEAETALSAEHAFLDLDGIQYALAYDDEMRKTDSFRGALLGCNTVSQDELVQLSGNYRTAWQNVGKAKDAWEKADAEMRRIMDLLEGAKETARQAEREYFKELRIAEASKIALNIEDC